MLQAHNWPGNVRQLRNNIERLMILARGDDVDAPITADLLPAEIGDVMPRTPNQSDQHIMALPLREAREMFEKDYLIAQINRFGGNISRTAEFIGRLDVERTALQRRQTGARRARPCGIDEPVALGAVELRVVRDRLDVRLVRAGRVGCERVRDRAFSRIPRDRAARVEAARKRDPDPLPAGSDSRITSLHALPLTSVAQFCVELGAGVVPSRAATKTVFSPAIVPATSSGSPRRSIASASGAAKPAGVARRAASPTAFMPLTRRQRGGEALRAGRRSSAPGSA